MSAPSWENLSEFFVPEIQGGFAKTARWSVAGQPRSAAVLFDDPAVEALLGGYEADASEPRITGRAAEFSGITRKTEITIDGLGAFYATANPLEDGVGTAVVTLARKTQHGQP